MNSDFLFKLLIFFASSISFGAAGVRHYNITEKQWDTQFSKGKWDYLGQVAIERARNSVIVGVFAHHFALNGRILDIGCGEGALADFLNEDQKKLYLGLDLSTEAIRIAKQKRSNLNFLVSDAEKYLPLKGHQANVIVFNEMLYYMDHVKVLKQYSGSEYLAKDGIIVICVWYTTKVNYLKASIFEDARKILEFVDYVDVSGVTGAPGKKKGLISFHIEAFRLRK
jgi:2-polyprenyl-3-methyl-5-hydroxy-6-metoxy-1,4-benzoquinol methylase